MKDLDPILADTIRYLEQLKESGVERVEVSPETLEALAVAPDAPRPALHAPSQAAIDPSPLAARQSPKATALDAIRQRAMACVECQELASKRKHVVFGVGNPEARLMFIGEAPGEDEDIQGEPFVGRAGQLLTKIIQAMGLKRHDIYIANILKCRPPGNRKPLPDEMANCLPFLKEQLEVIQPEVIVCLGASAVEGLLGLTGITKLRGNWLTYKLPSGREILVMPTFHPSYLLRNPEAKRPVWEDMQTVMAKLDLKIPNGK